MPRIRTVKPDFWHDHRIATDLTRDQRLFYIGLWNEADDDGRFLAHPRRLLGAIFPYETDLAPEFVTETLSALMLSGRLELYVVNGEPYAQLTKFKQHQRINRPTESRIPAPPPPKQVRKRSRKAHAPLTEPSLLERKGKEGKGNGDGNEKEQGQAAADNPDVWLATMQDMANRYAATIDDQTQRRTFNAEIRVIVNGSDATPWRDPKEGGQVPWSERPRLLDVALAKLESGERTKVRAALQLAIQQQFDPFPVKQSNAPPEGSDADAVRRGASLPSRIGEPDKRSQEEAEDAMVDAWLEANADGKRQVMLEIEMWFREHAAQWSGTHPSIVEGKTRQLRREKVLQRIRAAAA